MGLTSFTVSMKIRISFRPEESKKLRTHFLGESLVDEKTRKFFGQRGHFKLTLFATPIQSTICFYKRDTHCLRPQRLTRKPDPLFVFLIEVDH